MIQDPGRQGVGLRAENDDFLALDGERWVGTVDEHELGLLAFAKAPILDLGCGPGRHSEFLAGQGKIVVGVDLSEPAIETARAKGLSILARSVFDNVPKAGQWSTALLLDGNIGIGGNPVRLLRRTASLLVSDGLILVDVETHLPSPIESTSSVRLELDGSCGPWFQWAHVDMNDIDDIVASADLTIRDRWTRGTRHFLVIEIP